MIQHTTLGGFEKILGYADKVISGEISVREFGDLFDELTLYRNFYCEWYGEQSREYLLSNALLITSRAIAGCPDGVSVKQWFAKYPLYREWLNRITELRKNTSGNNFSSDFNMGATQFA